MQTDLSERSSFMACANISRETFLLSSLKVNYYVKMIRLHGLVQLFQTTGF